MGLLLVLACGCEPPQAPQGAAPSAAPLPPPLPPGVIEAKDATGTWNQAQVEQFIREDLDLTTMSLKSTGGDNYQGTGSNADGLSYELTVKQVPGGIKVDWTTSTGHGQTTFGNPVP